MPATNKSTGVDASILNEHETHEAKRLLRNALGLRSRSSDKVTLEVDDAELQRLITAVSSGSLPGVFLACHGVPETVNPSSEVMALIDTFMVRSLFRQTEDMDNTSHRRTSQPPWLTSLHKNNARRNNVLLAGKAIASASRQILRAMYPASQERPQVEGWTEVERSLFTAEDRANGMWTRFDFMVHDLMSAKGSCDTGPVMTAWNECKEALTGINREDPEFGQNIESVDAALKKYCEDYNGLCVSRGSRQTLCNALQVLEDRLHSSNDVSETQDSSGKEEESETEDSSEQAGRRFVSLVASLRPEVDLEI